MLGEGGGGNTLAVPCHVHDELQLIGCTLGVVHIGDAGFVFRAHFLHDDARGAASQPQLGIAPQYFDVADGVFVLLCFLPCACSTLCPEPMMMSKLSVTALS